MVMGVHSKGQNEPRVGTLEEIRPWVLKNQEPELAQHHERWVQEFEQIYNTFEPLKLVPEEIKQVLNGVPVWGPEGLETLRTAYCCYWFNMLYPGYGCAPECQCGYIDRTNLRYNPKGCEWCEESFPPEPCTCEVTCDNQVVQPDGTLNWF